MERQGVRGRYVGEEDDALDLCQRLKDIEMLVIVGIGGVGQRGENSSDEERKDLLERCHYGVPTKIDLIRRSLPSAAARCMARQAHTASTCPPSNTPTKP